MHRLSPRPRMYLIFAALLFCAVALHAKTILLDETDHSTHICLNVGDVLSVKLKSNVTTGYSWDTDSVPSCIREQQTKQKEKKNPRIGESGFQVFVFKATSPCNAVVTLHYFRPFEKDKPPAKIFSVDLSVQESSRNAGVSN